MTTAVNVYAWRRFWARMFDYFFFGSAFFIFTSTTIFAMNSFILYSILQIIIIISLEAVFLARFGTTPGKYLLGLNIVADHAPLDFKLALKRTFWAYVKGLWLGIPIMMFVPALYSRWLLKKTGTTIWDSACGTHVDAQPISIIRYVLFVLAFFIVFSILGNFDAFLQASQEQLPKI